MDPRVFKTTVRCMLATASCLLTLVSCSGSPMAPSGRLLVYVSENGDHPAPGKRIEIRGTDLSGITDENGLASFIVPVGPRVVRAYELGTPGPGRPYVEQTVEVVAARLSRAQFNDCTMCR